MKTVLILIVVGIMSSCMTKKSCDKLTDCLTDGKFRMSDGIERDEEFIIHFQSDSICQLINRVNDKEEAYPDKWILSRSENKDYLIIDGLRLAGPFEVKSWSKDTVIFVEDDSLEYYLIRLNE